MSIPERELKLLRRTQELNVLLQKRASVEARAKDEIASAWRGITFGIIVGLVVAALAWYFSESLWAFVVVFALLFLISQHDYKKKVAPVKEKFDASLKEIDIQAARLESEIDQLKLGAEA